MADRNASSLPTSDQERLQQQLLERVREQNEHLPEEVKDLPENVAVLISPVTGARIYVIGTAHVSLASAEEVRSVIRKVKPNQVLLELCAYRKGLVESVLMRLQSRAEELARDGKSMDEIMQQLMAEDDEKRRQAQAQEQDSNENNNVEQGEQNKQGWSHFLRDAVKSLRTNNSATSWLGIMLSGMYKKFSKQLSIEAGAEMKAGAQEAFYQGARIILGDRPIWITLQRTWNSMTIWQKLTLIGGILQAFFIKITPEEIEALKNGDLVAELITELAKYHPGLAKHVLEERDLYLVHTLRSCPGPVAVGVVGYAHLQGIKANWNADIDVKALTGTVPKRSSLRKAILYTFAILILFIAAIVAWMYS